MNDANNELKEVWKKISEEPYIFFATADRDQPRVRPAPRARDKNENMIVKMGFDTWA